MKTPKTPWYLSGAESARPRIRRWELNTSGKRIAAEDYPLKKFKGLVGNPAELAALVIRINHRDPEAERVKAMFEIEHAYISPAMLRRYQDWLHKKIPTPRNRDRNFKFLNNHVLGYFVRKRKLKDPSEWKKAELDWAHWLMKARHAPSTIAQIVVEGNRFLEWLHKERPEETGHIKLEPLDRYMRKDYRGVYEAENRANPTKYANRATVEAAISKVKDPRVRAAARIAHNYGLREAEVMGLQPGDVRKGHLRIERTMRALPAPTKPEYGPPKGKKARNCPHWFSRPQECLEWIQIVHTKLITPNTLGQLWHAEMLKQGLKIKFHDLRHCFATDSQRKAHRRDVQLAMGHEQSATLDRYTHDDQLQSDDEPLIKSA